MPKAAQVEPKWSQKAIKKAKQNVRKTLFRKGRFPDKKNMLQHTSFDGKGDPKGAFGHFAKCPKIPEIQFFSKDRHQDPPKTVRGSGFEKT